MGSALVALPLAGVALGGFRSPAWWTPAAALLWLAALDGKAPVSGRALKIWAPWLAWLAVSAALCGQPLKSLPAAARWFSVALFYGMARACWGAAERRRWLCGLWGAALLAGLAGLATGLHGLLDSGRGNEMTGFMPPYYNYTAFVEAAAAASLAVWQWRARPRGLRAAAGGAVLVVLTLLLLLARSRGGLLAAAAGIALAAARGDLRDARSLKKIAAGAAAAAAAVTLLAVARGLSPAFLLKLDRAASFKRPQIWKAALAVAADHPVFGEGPGNFEAGFLRHNFPAGFGLANYLFTTDYAHSEPFNVLAETGVVGLALLLWAIVSSLRGPPAEDADPVAPAAWAAVGAMGAQCLVDNMLQLPALALLFVGGLAVASGAPAQPRSLTPWPRRVLAGAGLLLALGAWMPAWLAAGDQSRAADEYDDQKRAELLRDARAIYPEDAGIRESLARAYLTATPPRPDLARAELEKAVALSPTNAVYWLDLAELLEARGEAFERAARRAADLEPNCSEARLMLAAAAARRGDRKAARAAFDEAKRVHGRIGDVGGGGFTGRVCAFDARRFAAVRKMVESAR